MAQRLRSSGRFIFRALNQKYLNGAAASPKVHEGLSLFRDLAPASVKRKASNTFSAIQDTYFSTKEVFESHRVVFTVGTSIASILTAWAGYSLRQHHQSNVERRLESIEKAMMKTYDVEHKEIKRIVNTGNISTTACIAAVGTSLIIGYSLGWRGGLWFANRKFKREQLKLMEQVKPRGWQSLRSHFVRFRNKNQSLPKNLDLPANAPATSATN